MRSRNFQEKNNARQDRSLRNALARAVKAKKCYGREERAP